MRHSHASRSSPVSGRLSSRTSSRCRPRAASEFRGTFEQQRDQLPRWAENRGEAGMVVYRKTRNAVSLDGLLSPPPIRIRRHEWWADARLAGARTSRPSYQQALERGWSPDNVRGEVARLEELRAIAADPGAFLAAMVDREAAGALDHDARRHEVRRLPGYRKWMGLTNSSARSDQVVATQARRHCRRMFSVTSDTPWSRGCEVTDTPRKRCVCFCRRLVPKDSPRRPDS